MLIQTIKCPKVLISQNFDTETTASIKEVVGFLKGYNFNITVNKNTLFGTSGRLSITFTYNREKKIRVVIATYDNITIPISNFLNLL